MHSLKRITRTSGQDGGVGGYIVPPRTTKRRTTTNLKTKINQNFQKIKLSGSPTTEELKKKHSSGLVGRAEMGSRDREDSQQGRGWQTRWSDIRVQISQEKELGSETDHATQGSSEGK